MTKYDVIYESLQEKLDNEEITLEEANELNNLAYEKYGETEIEEDDSITLEEAMDVISDYLTEAEAHKLLSLERLKKSGILDQDSDTREKFHSSLDNLKKSKVKANIAHDTVKNMKMSKKEALKNFDRLQNFKGPEDAIAKGRKFLDVAHRTEKDIQNVSAKNTMLQKLADQGRVKGRTIDGKYKVLDKEGKNIIKKVSPKSVHESVDDLRLQVYEAYESGLIEESTKDLFLIYLNLENYE